MRYKKLGKKLQDKGYEVVYKNPNWYKTLSEQIFPVENNSIICGFSFGGVLAYLIAKKYSCKKIIFASLSPIHLFTFDGLRNDYMEHMSKKMAEKLAREIKNIKISLNSLDSPYVTLVGEKEKILLEQESPQIIVPDSGHYMTSKYIKCIQDLL